MRFRYRLRPLETVASTLPAYRLAVIKTAANAASEQWRVGQLLEGEWQSPSRSRSRPSMRLAASISPGSERRAPARGLQDLRAVARTWKGEVMAVSVDLATPQEGGESELLLRRVEPALYPARCLGRSRMAQAQNPRIVSDPLKSVETVLGDVRFSSRLARRPSNRPARRPGERSRHCRPASARSDPAAGRHRPERS